MEISVTAHTVMWVMAVNCICRHRRHRQRGQLWMILWTSLQLWKERQPPSQIQRFRREIAVVINSFCLTILNQSSDLLRILQHIWLIDRRSVSDGRRTCIPQSLIAVLGDVHLPDIALELPG